MRQQQAFTLVELLVVLAVMAILVGVVFPGFQGMLARNNLSTSANSMILAINYARSEAVREGGGVTLDAVDPSDDSNEWGPGWEVSSADGTLLRTFEAVGGDLILDSPDDVSSIAFTSQGGVAAGASRTLDLCLPGVSGVQITIAAIGRASTSDLTAAECP